MAPHPLILFSGLVLLDSPAAASLWEVQLNSPSPSGFAGQRRHLATLLALHGGSSHSDAPNAVKLSSVSFASPRSKRAKELRVATNLLLWWSLNVVFNLANKQCLNSWQHPWALATTHLAVGSACMLPLWLPYPSLSADGIGWASVREPPSLTTADLRTLLPVVLLLATGHATSTLAPAYGTVAFSNIIKTAEPLFTCIFAALLYKRIFSPAVYASLLVVVIGCVHRQANHAHAHPNADLPCTCTVPCQCAHAGCVPRVHTHGCVPRAHACACACGHDNMYMYMYMYMHMNMYMCMCIHIPTSSADVSPAWVRAVWASFRAATSTSRLSRSSRA